MGFPDGMRAGGTVMDEVKRWHAVTLAVLAMAFPLCWFLSEEAAQWLTRALFWLLVARVLTGERSPCRDTVVQLCVLLALTVVLIFGSSLARHLNGTSLRLLFWIVLGLACSAFASRLRLRV